jgi:hypothetical protein
MAHGLTQFESNLFYYMQSGAVNESLSDIWGELIDLSYTNGLDNDSSTVRWKLGENLPIGAIRDMKDPTVFGDPDRMLSANYYCGTADNGGVHTNSGVGNKAAYLMVDGGTFNGYTVTGIGIDKTIKIFYEAQTNLLTSAADYQDLHDALNQACTNLTGTVGITTANCDQVRKAIAAVEMNFQPATCTAPHAPLCNGVDFDSQFNDSATGWYVTNGVWYYNANYLFSYGVPASFSSALTTYNKRDFEYTVRMRRMGCDGCTNALYVRAQAHPLGSDNIWYSGYFFAYSRSGYFSVFKIRSGGTAIPLQGWTSNGAILTGDTWNTLRVVADGINLYFYINNSLVWSGSDSELWGKEAGVTFYRTSDSTGDLLEVDWATMTGGSPTALYYDSFENIWQGWAHAALSGADHWSREIGYSSSGDHMLYGWDPNVTTDYYMAMTQNITLPPHAFLHFKHAYDFESNYDGGVLEYSTNNGSTWIDASALFTHNGYNGVISASFDNPLGGRAGFVRESYGYLSSRLALNSLSGQNVRFRFRIGSDYMVDDLGWLIDDVRLYNCSNHAIYTPLLRIGAQPTSFNSTFTYLAPNWTAVQGDWEVNNSYLLSGGEASKYSSVSYLGDFSNFDYQVRMRRNGLQGSANRILIRGIPNPTDSTGRWYSFIAFSYSADGYYSIWKRVSGSLTSALVGWTVSSAINTGYNWNTLRVVANGSNYNFYINGTLLWSGSDTSLSWGQVGIEFYRDEGSTGNLLEVDWATLYSLALSGFSFDDFLPGLSQPWPVQGGNENQSPVR